MINPFLDEDNTWRDLMYISELIEKFSQLAFKHEKEAKKYRQEVRDLIDSLALDME
jgi:hypothetical protein